MNRHTVARLLVAFVGVLLCLVGLLHAVVNVRGLQRAAAHGEIAERLVPQMIVNVVFGGATLFMCGAILVLFAFGLRAPSRTLWSIGLLIGLFLLSTGVAAYLWEPIPSVLVFSVLGALVCVPLLLWRTDFTKS
jgi:drug/metabolite transporter (DMT)-like permease